MLCATLHAVATPLRGGLTQALGAMGKFIVNLLISLVTFPLVYAVASLASFAWIDAFVADRIFTEYFGFMAGDSLLVWAFYFIFFVAVGIGFPALLRTHRPLIWATSFGLAYSLYRLVAGTHYIFYPDMHLYVQLAGEYAMPALGCAVGALLGRRIRGMAPNNSFKPTPHRGVGRVPKLR